MHVTISYRRETQIPIKRDHFLTQNPKKPIASVIMFGSGQGMRFSPKAPVFEGRATPPLTSVTVGNPVFPTMFY